MENLEDLRREYEVLVAVMCKALNDPKRLMILTFLGDSPKTVSDLVELLGSSQANVSQHLAVLRDRGLVRAVRDGSSVIYSLRHPRILDAVTILRTVMHDELELRQGLRAGSSLRMAEPVS